ncbi:MAG: ABC transporter permease subunit [Bacteroidota bacterium]
MFAGLLYSELIKIFSKPRSYIGFVAITIIVSLIQMAMYLDGLNYFSFVTGPLQASFNLEGNLVSGNMVAFVIIQTLILQIPLLVALVTGDLISGESATGTLRILASKPVSRTAILFAKFTAGLLYTLLLLIWLGFMSWGLALFIFGPGDLIVLKSEELIILQNADIGWRFLLAFGISFISLSVVATFSLCLSCFADNSIGPIISTMAVIILFTIMGTLEIPFFDAVKPYLFTTHMIVWRNSFDLPVSTPQICTSLTIMIAHIILFLSVALYRFNKKDILS